MAYVYTISPQLYEPENQEPIGVFRNLEYRAINVIRPTQDELTDFVKTDFVKDGFFVKERGVRLPPTYFEIHIFDENGNDWK